MPISLADVTLPRDPATPGKAATARYVDAWRRRDLPPAASQLNTTTALSGAPSNAQTSTLASGYVLHRPPQVTLQGSDKTGQFRFPGVDGVAPIGVTGTEPTYVLGSSRYPNTNGSQNVMAVEFCTDAAAIQWRHRHMTASAGYRLLVDGLPYTIPATLTPGTGAGATNLNTITFTSAAPRHIRIESYYMPFGGVAIPPTATIWAPPVRGPRLMVLGDSISDGSNENTAAGAGTWVFQGGRMLGCSDIWEQAKGGTGYVAAGTSAKFIDRVALDIYPYDPDILVVFGGVNDVGTSAVTVGAAADTLYAALKANVSNAAIYVVGIYDPTGNNTDSSRIGIDNALKASAAAAGFPFISPMTGKLFNSAGTQIEEQGPWITTANEPGYVGTDNVHPTNSGHTYLAQRIVTALSPLLPA